MSDLKVPEWHELNWDQPAPTVSLPQAWEAGSSIAVEIADREIARLLVNCCLYDPPIKESEIRAFARRFKISEREAEIEIRRQRNA